METIVRLYDGRLVISHALGLPADAARYWSDRWRMWRDPVLRLSETHDELESKVRRAAEKRRAASFGWSDEESLMERGRPRRPSLPTPPENMAALPGR